MNYAPYVHEVVLKVVLFRGYLESTTLGLDVKETVEQYFDHHGSEWKMFMVFAQMWRKVWWPKKHQCRQTLAHQQP